MSSDRIAEIRGLAYDGRKPEPPYETPDDVVQLKAALDTAQQALAERTEQAASDDADWRKAVASLVTSRDAFKAMADRFRQSCNALREELGAAKQCIQDLTAEKKRISDALKRQYNYAQQLRALLGETGPPDAV